MNGIVKYVLGYIIHSSYGSLGYEKAYDLRNEGGKDSKEGCTNFEVYDHMKLSYVSMGVQYMRAVRYREILDENIIVAVGMKTRRG